MVSKIYNFTLDEIKLTNIHFALNKDYKPPKDKKIEIDTSISVDYKVLDTKLLVVVGVSSDNKSAPFAFLVEGAGYFAFDEKPPLKEIDKIARMNCATIVFPYIRETIADLTRRGGVVPLHLSPVNFVALYKANEESKASEGKKQVVTKQPKKKVVRK